MVQATGASGSTPIAARKITWEHEGLEYVAQVGKPMRWRKAADDRRHTKAGAWVEGMSVIEIIPGPTRVGRSSGSPGEMVG